MFDDQFGYSRNLRRNQVLITIWRQRGGVNNRIYPTLNRANQQTGKPAISTCMVDCLGAAAFL